MCSIVRFYHGPKTFGSERGNTVVIHINPFPPEMPVMTSPHVCLFSKGPEIFGLFPDFLFLNRRSNPVRVVCFQSSVNVQACVDPTRFRSVYRHDRPGWSTNWQTSSQTHNLSDRCLKCDCGVRSGHGRGEKLSNPEKSVSFPLKSVARLVRPRRPNPKTHQHNKRQGRSYDGCQDSLIF